MKIISMLLILSVSALLLSGCLGSKEYEYLHDASEIRAVEIVEASYDCENHSLGFSILASVCDVVDFTDRLADVKYSSVFHDPFAFDDKALAIKITYANGDYEAFTDATRAVYDNQSKSVDYMAPIYNFDTQGFDELVLHYLSGVKSQYTYMGDISEILTIDYVAVGSDGGEKTYNVVASVDDIASFLSDVSKVEYFFDAPGNDTRDAYVQAGDAVFMITYKNGDYELFGKTEREEYCSVCGKSANVHIGYFDSDQFDELVLKYALNNLLLTS